MCNYLLKIKRSKGVAMKKFRNLWVVYFLLLLTSFSYAWAQGDEKGSENTITLKDMIVTATKTEKSLKDAPGNVSVITSDEMKKKHIKTVDDALNTLAGIFVKRSKGLMDTTASVRLRGFAGDKYTLVLIDGQPINDAYTGGIEWGSIPVENIEKIEIVRGPASALYGGHAMGGVINIITKTPDKLNFIASGGYGTHDTYRYRISLGDKFWNKMSFRLGYEEESTNGYATTPVYKTISTGIGNVVGGYPMEDKYGNSKYWVVGNKGDNGAEKKSFSGKLRWDFSNTGNITFTAISGRHDYDYGHPETYMGTFGPAYAVAGYNKQAKFQPNDFISYTGIGRKEFNFYSLAFKKLFNTFEINAQVGTVITDDRYTLETGSGTDDYNNSPGKLSRTQGESWFSEVSGNVPLGNSHIFTLGLYYRTDSADTKEYNIPFYRSFSHTGPRNYYTGGDSKNWAIFLQDEWHILEPVTLYLGCRYDSWKVYNGQSGKPGSETKYDSNTESEISPRAALVWSPYENTTLRASVGHAFRPPTIYELYRTWRGWSTLYKGNPGLKPETMWSYELGIEHYLFNKQTKISVTGYRNDIEDLIYSKIEDSTKTRTNAGKARTYGLELEVYQKIATWLNVWTNYTYTQSRIKDNPTDPESEGKQVPEIPKHTWNFGIDTHYKWITGSIIGRYFSKIYTDPHNKDKEEGVYGTYEPAFIMDAKVVITPIKCMEFSLSVDNIFNKRYYEYYKTDKRTFFAEIKFRY